MTPCYPMFILMCAYYMLSTYYHQIWWPDDRDPVFQLNSAGLIGSKSDHKPKNSIEHGHSALLPLKWRSKCSAVGEPGGRDENFDAAKKMIDFRATF